MEGDIPGENTQFAIGSFVEQHSSVPSEITIDFTQIELNITVVDKAHAGESIMLGIDDILKLDNLEVMVMATNKEGECKRLFQEVLLIIAQEDPYMIHLLGR
jgi:GTPase